MRQMMFNLDSFATILFTADISALEQRPVNNEEWYEVERILKMHGYNGPASLFVLSKDKLLDSLGIDEFVVYKITKRLEIMNDFLKVLYEYQNQGIDIITKYDKTYPRILTKKMRKKAPTLLYVIGNMPEQFEGISIMGLLTLKKKDRAYTKQVVDKIADEGKWLISTDNKGVDQTAFLYALNKKCNVISFVCDKLVEKASVYRRQVKNGSLVVVSAVEPGIHFDVTNALDRNSYVCGLSNYQIIISSKINSGHTWFTCMHNMHNNWTNQLVLENDYSGNIRLSEMKATLIKPVNILSDLTFDEIYEMNKRKEELDMIDIDQMSIFEFIGVDDGN